MSLCSSLWPPVILPAERRFPTRWISPDSPGQSTNKPTPHRKRASSIMLRCKSWCYLRGSALSLMRSEPTPLHDGLGGQHLLEDSYLFVEERYSSCCSVELSTSWTVMRPAEPVPSTIERSTPAPSLYAWQQVWLLPRSLTLHLLRLRLHRYQYASLPTS